MHLKKILRKYLSESAESVQDVIWKKYKLIIIDDYAI